MQRLAHLIGGSYLLICLITLLAVTFIGPLGYAPFPLTLGPAQAPVEVTVWYGTEKQAWLEEATRRFLLTNPHVGNRPIQITLKGVGSREQAERVARQDWGTDPPPTVISPASSLWTAVLETDWAARNPGAQPIIATGADSPRALVLTPIVIVAWERRAQALWPNGSTTFWQSIHDALVNPDGWVGVVDATQAQLRPEVYQALRAEAATWGLVKFGQTRPTTSNSGAQALMLLAYGFHQKARGLTAADVTSAPFRAWLKDVQSGVLEFGDSTGTFMTSMVQFGPSKYDLVVTYENLALEHMEAARGRWGQNLRIYYPPSTMMSDHPYILLQGPWVTREQAEGARLFRTYLLSRSVQELALTGVDPAHPFGFRPSDPTVPIVTSDASNPFHRFQQAGAQIDVPQLVEMPSGEVVTALLDVWRRDVNR